MVQPQDQTISDEGKKRLGWEGISSAIQNKYKSLSILDKLHMFFRYQRVYSTAWNGTDPQYLGPMFSRIKTRLESLNKVVDIVPAAQMGNAYRSGKSLTIYSFVHANQEIKRILPMLIANMIYDEQKRNSQTPGRSPEHRISLSMRHTTYLVTSNVMMATTGRTTDWIPSRKSSKKAENSASTSLSHHSAQLTYHQPFFPKYITTSSIDWSMTEI